MYTPHFFHVENTPTDNRKCSNKNLTAHDFEQKKYLHISSFTDLHTLFNKRFTDNKFQTFM